MSEPTQLPTTRLQRFMSIVQAQMAEFERREADFRKKDREERAKVLNISIRTEDKQD